jgi:hypothetical protein
MRLFCTLVFAAFSCSPLLLTAQTALHFFSDTVATGNHNRALATARENQFIYIGGQSFDGDGFAATPSVVKLDTAGNTIWSYSLNKEIDQQVHDAGTYYGDGSVKLLIVDAHAVYAHFSKGYQGINEIWKLDKLTGNILWKRPIPEPMFMVNANDNEICITYNANGNYNYDLISKSTGLPAAGTKVIGKEINWLERNTISFGPDGAAYISRNDTVTRYSSSSLSTVSWHKQIIQGGYVSRILAHEDGSLYIFGHRFTTFSEPLVFGRFNSADGNTIWLTKPPVNSYNQNELFTEVKVSGDFVYASSIHELYGSVYTAYHIWKFNRTTGINIYNSAYHPLSAVGPLNPGDPYSAALSFDVDANGNVYATGYEAAGDSRIAEWGICKFNPQGNVVYHHRIFDDAPYASKHSRGVLSYFFNNRMYYVGELQKGPATPGSYVHLVASDTGSAFLPYRFKKTEAQYQEFSSVKKILPYSNAKYAVYSQLGHGVRVYLKDSRNGATIWQKDFRRGAHLLADQMTITADQKILISCIRYNSYQMRHDYLRQPDSLFFIKLDSLGNSSTEYKHAASAMINLRSIQLYANGDSNNVYIYSMRDYYNNENSIHLYNIEKATAAISSFSCYISSLFIPLQGRQNLMISKGRDSAIHIHNRFPTANEALYKAYKFDKDYPYSAGFTALEQARLYNEIVVQNIVRYNPSTVICSGKSRTSTRYQICRYHPMQTSLTWNLLRPDGHTVEGISASFNSVYWSGKYGASLVIGRLNPDNGTIAWEKSINPSLPNQFYIPLDQQYNPVKHEYTICGYIEDRTNFTFTQEAFFVIVDTVGNIIQQWKQAGDYNKNNQLNTIAISQFGQTLIGGALYKDPYGRSAVLIEADTIVKVIAKPQPPTIRVSPSAAVCQGDTVTLTATAPADCEKCTFLWNDALQTAGQTMKTTVSGTYEVVVTNSAGSAMSSQQVIIKPIPPKPLITRTGDSLQSSAATGNQWYLDGNPIANANNQFLHPPVAGNYKVQVTDNGCHSPMSNDHSFSFRVITNPPTSDEQVQVFPNPITDKLVIINKLDHSLDVQLFDAMGKLMVTFQVTAKSTKEQFASHLKQGIYMLLITDTQTMHTTQKRILKQ